MKKRKNFVKVVILFFLFTCIAASIMSQVKEAPNPVPDTPGFDVSIFFTGNIQGNIEPCG
jgi:hypothetical protein